MSQENISHIALQILEILKEHPEGLDIEQIREHLSPLGVQQHLDRRLRELDPAYVITRRRESRRTLYGYSGPRKEGEWDYDTISKTLQAKILSLAGGRCQMCGKTIAEDRLRIHVDHKIPREWGGKTEEGNLQALCSACNEGKKNYYATYDTDVMKRVLAHNSVHKRIAELLHINQGQWVDCDLIEFVANAAEYQTDWRKRLRELRYLGLEIETMRKNQEKRAVSYYRLLNWIQLPEDPTKAAREYEAERARKNKL